MKVQMLVVQGRPDGSRLRFPPGDYLFGRGPECQVRFNSAWVSRQHCRLRVTEAVASLSDLGSHNGTLVNGQLLRQECNLNDGDLVQIGPVVFRVCLPSEVEEQDDILIAGWDAPATGAQESTANLPALLPPEDDRGQDTGASGQSDRRRPSGSD